MNEQLTREEECERILQSYEHRFDRVSAVLDAQLQTLHNRAQLLLGLCGLLISASVLVTTGRIIGRADFRHEHMAGLWLIGAGVMEIAAASVIVTWVLRVRWITQEPGADLRSWVMNNLAYRDRKTRAYRLGMVLLLVAMVLYQCAVSIVLIQL